jgi:transcription initiation protein SPT3
VQARALASKRGLRFLTAEDLIFLIRHDRAKVNRLRTYLSWKDVRKHAKDSGGDVGPGIEPDGVEEGPEGAGMFDCSVQSSTPAVEPQ